MWILCASWCVRKSQVQSKYLTNLAAGHFILSGKELWSGLSRSTPAPLSASVLPVKQLRSLVPAAEHGTSGYSSQSFLFSSLQLAVQRWALRHLPGALHSYTRHINSLPNVTSTLVYSQGDGRANSSTVALDMLPLQEMLQQSSIATQLRGKQARSVL